MRVDPNTLSELLRYEPGAGKLFWRERSAKWFDGCDAGRICKAWNTRYAGSEAFTTLSTTGYFYGNVLNRKHFTHRVAFALMTGRYPDYADHIDGDKLNNKWANLREANASENARNVASAIGSSSKFLGVYLDKTRGGWVANITIDGRTTYIGRFGDEVQAALAYDAAASKNYGEFARLNFPDLVEL